MMLVWRRTRHPAAVAIIGLNPLVVVSVVNGAHNDAWVGLLVLVGVLLVDRNSRKSGLTTCPTSSPKVPTLRRYLHSKLFLQAMSVLNDRFIVRQCESFALRVSKMSGDVPAQIEAAYQLALGRAPTPKENQALVAYATKFGMANACRVILNSNEFMFVN